MTDQRWQKIEEVFLLALDRAAQERAAFVAEACGGDDEMLKEVHSLIAAHEKAEGFIESPVFEDGLQVVIGAQNEPAAERLVGPYKIIEEIGRGGMGVVYRALRADDEYQRVVAIKLIRRGLDSDFIVSRFRNERQILANLAHPNITRLFNGGRTEDGSPYLVMEYIEGEPIDEYCDAHRLSINERLQLFRTVCSAVHYAHQNLIIHRDIKPGNILVTADGAVKLLDFGIAKLLGPKHPSQTTDKTTTTIRLMTPEYASPEQVRGETITTATDVYSLGVLLYKLLTGHHPYRFKRTRPEEIERAICEEEPERPSVALSRVEEVPGRDGATQIALTPESVSTARAAEPQTLRRKLAGDLDNIVLMAMRKEAQRRYVSAEQFSEDLRRHLEGLPVMAHTDTFTYRSAKFIRRNKAAVVAAALVALILIAGIIATAWQAEIAAHQAKRAAEQAKLATEQRNKARVETAKAERINAFLQTILSYADPNWYSPGHGQRGDVKVIDALNEAAGRIDTELADQPEVKAELHHTIGNTYHALGFYDKAERHFRAALALRRAMYGEQHPKVAESLYYLGAARFHEGDRASAEALYGQAIAMLRALDKENVNLPYMLEDLGWLLVLKPDTTAAEPLLKEALELFRKHYGEDHVAVATIYQNFGRLYEARGDLDRAQALFEETVERARRLADGSILAGALTDLGRLHRHKGKYAAAETALMEALAWMSKSVGASHPSAAQVFYELADTHSLKHDYAKAEAEARSALEIMRRTSTEEGPGAIPVLSLLSKDLIKAGQRARGQAYLHKALALYRTAQEKGRPDYDSASHLGECLTLLRRYPEAESFLLEGYHYFKAHYGEQHPSTAEVQQRLVKLYQAWGKPEQAARLGAIAKAGKKE